MKKTGHNPLLDDLAAFEAMSHGERRAAGRRTRLEEAAAGRSNKVGHCTARLPGGGTSRFTLFSE